MNDAARGWPATLLDAIGAELDAIARQVAAGFDVAPLRRARLEGLTAAVLAGPAAPGAGVSDTHTPEVVAPEMAVPETGASGVGSRGKRGSDKGVSCRGDAQQLLEYCRQRLPADAQVALSPDGRTLQFDIWQRRAPVYPTTAD